LSGLPQGSIKYMANQPDMLARSKCNCMIFSSPALHESWQLTLPINLWGTDSQKWPAPIYLHQRTTPCILISERGWHHLQYYLTRNSFPLGRWLPVKSPDHQFFFDIVHILKSKTNWCSIYCLSILLSESWESHPRSFILSTWHAIYLWRDRADNYCHEQLGTPERLRYMQIRIHTIITDRYHRSLKTNLKFIIL